MTACPLKTSSTEGKVTPRLKCQDWLCRSQMSPEFREITREEGNNSNTAFLGNQVLLPSLFSPCICKRSQPSILNVYISDTPEIEMYSVNLNFFHVGGNTRKVRTYKLLFERLNFICLTTGLTRYQAFS